MSKKDTVIRVLIRGKGNQKFYKIFSFSLTNDRFGNAYIKIHLPCREYETVESKVAEGQLLYTDSQFSQVHTKGQISEFSYKLETGDSHFKSRGATEYSGRIKGSATPKDKKVIEIARVGIASLDESLMYLSNEYSLDDILLLKEWDESCRSISIFVINGDINALIVNSDMQNYTLNHEYTTRFHRIPGYQIILSDNSFTGKANYKGVCFFRLDDPTRCHRE